MAITKNIETPTEKPEPRKPLEKKVKKGRRAYKQTTGLVRRDFTRKDGTIYQGDIWYMRYSIQDPKDPKKRKKMFVSTGTAVKEDAERMLNVRKAQVIENRHPDLKKDGTTFKDFVNNSYLPHCSDQESYDRKERLCKNLIEEFGNYNLSDITASMLSAHREKRKKAGNKVGTINRVLACIKHIYTVANMKEFKLVSDVKLAEIRSIKNKKEPAGRINYLSKAEVKTLLKKAEGSYLHQIIRWSINTGIRKGRTFQLTWNQIDVANGFIHLPVDKNGDRYDAPLHPKAMEVIKERLAVRKDDIPYVFYNEATLTRWFDAKKAWATLTKEAGLVDFHFHDMRHTFISWLVMSGADLKAVQQLAGHKSFAMTLRYTHLSPTHTMQAVNMLSYEEESDTQEPAETEPETEPKA